MASLPHSLKPAARSAYRAVLRSARITFDGDPPRRLALQTAVRQTLSSPTLSTHGQASTSSPTASSSNTSEATEVEQSKRIEEWLEVALFLRRNVVQGVQEEEGAFRLRVTPDTELGDNAAIRDPPKLSPKPFPNRDRRKRVSSK